MEGRLFYTLHGHQVGQWRLNWKKPLYLFFLAIMYILMTNLFANNTFRESPFTIGKKSTTNNAPLVQLL